jgi:hypothetical protein
MTALIVALNENVIDLLPYCNRAVLVSDHLGVSRDDESKHLLGPKAELGSRLLRVARLGEDGEDVIVHGLRHECLLPLLGIQTLHVFGEDHLKVGFAREAISAIAGVDLGGT